MPTTQLGDAGENTGDKTLVILVLRDPFGLSLNKSLIGFVAAVWVNKVKGTRHRPPKEARMHRKSRLEHEQKGVTD